jgi:hypothetical protein
LGVVRERKEEEGRRRKKVAESKINTEKTIRKKKEAKR